MQKTFRIYQITTANILQYKTIGKTFKLYQIQFNEENNQCKEQNCHEICTKYIM